ncbi:carboxymuconolactone decarboxylase family protein [Actinokineospora iranica]|uniref:Alkylhydroperoxidase AhpD family core domain-containing protein n=1 Tax=Actinokineospora iranica TaxID=1271860 RepID=A0A1G6S585_9PSEU|nr:carboxymuconolactone decarboxylase family protein [Actinokineospora iranica]SDD11824.1 alkylhydroperoxidase AhpD family core domain-containing protein [Actinokineospora iranica]
MTAGRDVVYLDKQAPHAYQALRDVAKAVRTAAREAGLDRRLMELVNLRVSQLNGCAYCLDLHTQAAMSAGETQRRLAVLSAWRATELFSPTERAALRLAESVTTLPDPEALAHDYTAARAVLTDAQLSTVVWAVITMNAFNRVSIMSGHPVRAETP